MKFTKNFTLLLIGCLLILAAILYAIESYRNTPQNESENVSVSQNLAFIDQLH